MEGFSHVDLRTGIVGLKVKLYLPFKEIARHKMWPQYFTFLPTWYEVLVSVFYLCQWSCIFISDRYVSDLRPWVCYT